MKAGGSGAEFECSFSSALGAKESRLFLKLQIGSLFLICTETDGYSYWKP